MGILPMDHGQDARDTFNPPRRAPLCVFAPRKLDFAVFGPPERLLNIEADRTRT